MAASRRSRRLAAALGLSLATGSLGCTAALPHPTAQDASAASVRWPGTTARDLERARSLYVRRCAGCHSLVLPRAYPAAAWPALVDAMTERSRVTPEEAESLKRLLATLSREDAPASAPQR